MNTLASFPKSRLFILLFVLTFTSLPGAFSLNAKTTGNFKENNDTDPSTRCNRETRTYIMTTSAWSGRYCHTRQISNIKHQSASRTFGTHYTSRTFGTHFTQHTNN